MKSPQSPKTITASGTSLEDSINMLTGTSIQQEYYVPPLERWSIHHHIDLRRWWESAEKETETRKHPARKKLKKKPAKRNQGFHLAWFNLWWSRMLIEAKLERENHAQASRLCQYLNQPIVKPIEKLQCDSSMIPASMGLSRNDTCNILKPDEKALQFTLSSKKRSLIFDSQSPAKKVKPNIQIFHTTPAKKT
jgi:hypothetical protein